MEAARRIVLFEAGMGAAWILLGVLNAGPDGLRDGWWLAVAAFVATAGATYADEHRLVDVDEWHRYAFAIVSVVAATAGCAVVIVATDMAVLTVVGVGFVGMGAGLVVYRVVYGVVRPLPESRLEGARDRAV
ncbi:hypothetical protein [Halosimplex sp. J119]